MSSSFGNNSEIIPLISLDINDKMLHIKLKTRHILVETNWFYKYFVITGKKILNTL